MAPEQRNGDDEALATARAAFLAGDHVTSRRLAEARLAGGIPAERDAARTFLERFRGDPVVLAIVVGALIFFAACVLLYAQPR